MITKGTLIETALIQLLSEEKCNDTEILDTAYKDFIRAITDLCDNSTDYQLLFRILIHTQNRIEMFRSEQNEMKTAQNQLHVKYLSAADGIIESELQLLNERLIHPAIFQQSARIDIPNLYWNSKFSKRALVELLTSVEHLGPILNAVGKLVSFSALVTFAEKTLHIFLSNAYKNREEVLSRKTKSADFLKRLIEALIEKQKNSTSEYQLFVRNITGSTQGTTRIYTEIETLTCDYSLTVQRMNYLAEIRLFIRGLEIKVARSFC